MRYVIGITLFALTLAGLPARAEERGEKVGEPRLIAEARIELKVGEQRLITVGELTRLALGSVDFAEVRTVGSTQVEVTGQAPGSTKLLVWRRSGERVEYTVVVSGDPKAPTDETVTLKKGDTRELQVKGLKRVAVGDPGVADIVVGGKDVVRITASRAGETTLLVWGSGDQERRAYRIVVKD